MINLILYYIDYKSLTIFDILYLILYLIYQNILFYIIIIYVKCLLSMMILNTYMKK